MSDIRVEEIDTTARAVRHAHTAVAQHQTREATGLAARIEQLTRWAARDSASTHIQEITAER